MIQKYTKNPIHVGQKLNNEISGSPKMFRNPCQQND
jgi:hypothetical protein